MRGSVGRWAPRIGVVLALALAPGAFGLGGLIIPARAAAPEIVPAGHDSDIRFLGADGTRLDGLSAFTRMPEAGLTVWVAGNQFFAMSRVIGDFQALHPGVSVGLMTLPPGMILKAIQAHGWTYGTATIALEPDVYGTVSVSQLRETGHISSYIVYMHNVLELMVARGNPKHVVDLNDLTRPDLRVMLPNPVNEGIMTFYAKPILQRLGLWTALSRDKDCADCDGAPHVHFTNVHHRETPAGIANGTVDAGLVWRTEAMAAIADGAPVQGVALPAGQNAAEEVAYVAGALDNAPHPAAAAAFIAFLRSQAGQDAYASFGFLPATEAERAPRPVLAGTQ